MKYANDLSLTDLSRKMKNYLSEYDRAITDGKLKQAFLLAMEVERYANLVQRRLNEIEYP